MPFYRVTRSLGTLGLRASLKTDKPYYSKWTLPGLDEKKWVLITNPMVMPGIMGLYLRHTTVLYNKEIKIPVLELLIGEDRWYFPDNDVTIVSDEEIEQELKNDPA